MKNNSYTYRFLLLLFYTLSTITSNSQEFPPITVFTTENYGAENQNWAVSQADNSFVYVANNKGLLEYNGANWRLYPTPNQTIMRSVKVFGNQVFTGFYMDFGFWVKNDFGVLEYKSIVAEQDVKMLVDEQVWDILEVDGWVLFKSLERIYLYNLQTKNVKIINAKHRIETISKIDGVIYFQELNTGVFKIENGISKLVSNDKIIKETVLVSLFKRDNKLVFLTQEKGFYFLEDTVAVKWNIPGASYLNGKSVYSAKKIRNGDFIIGTISNGVLCLDKNGAYKYQITQNTGLSNNTVLAVFEDAEKNLWLGLDNGINLINNASPFKIFTQNTNFWGTIYAAIVYKENLYIGTNQGLYFRKINSREPFQFIEKTQGQVWSLEIIENTLFCGHNTGTYTINNGKATKIQGIQGTWSFLKKDANTVVQGNYDGLYVLKKENSKWVLKNKIEGFDTSSRFVVLSKTGQIIVNHEYKGVFILNVDESLTRISAIKKDNSVKKEIYSSLIKYHDTILYANSTGVYKFIHQKSMFEKDTLFSRLISEDKFSSAKLVFNKADNHLWSFSKEDITSLMPGKFSKIPVVNRIPIREALRKGKTGFENIIHLKNKKQLVGTSNGFVVVDLDALKMKPNFEISINSVKNFKTDESKINVGLAENAEFTSKANNMEFSYSIPNYDKTSITKYQYQLSGLQKFWSTPMQDNAIVFENIPYGSYTFKVRAIVGGDVLENEAQYQFVINKPWFLSPILIVVYIIVILLLLYASHLFTRKYYKSQKVALLENAQKELDLKEMESVQKIMKINNEKLRVDIESKNRELATSTMNIIKKNDFLNTIKTELVTSKGKNVNKVITIIDKNLNNTDDWKMFKEAFNNADKKFLKKLKKRHSDLTPNDLRLCAYLRLNLTSKEIAPLLNISARSVEVKRYRLRKKMNLGHDINLTNYILEI